MLWIVRTALGTISCAWACWLFVASLPALQVIGPTFLLALGAWLLTDPNERSNSAGTDLANWMRLIESNSAARKTMQRAKILGRAGYALLGISVFWTAIGGLVFGREHWIWIAGGFCTLVLLGLVCIIYFQSVRANMLAAAWRSEE